MRKTKARSYLLAAVWPAGEAVIAAATAGAVRRASGRSTAHSGRRPASRHLADALPGRRADRRRPDLVQDSIRLGAASCVSGALAYEVMRLLGPAVMKYGPKIDEPIAHWTADHQVKQWARVMERFTKVGNTWTTWGAASAAAVSLAVTWPERKWLPPAVLGSAVVVDHYATIALRRKFGRVGPPSSPAGTYPCGGVDRVILFYGLIAYLLWREFSGTAQGRAWAIGTVAALSFNQAYSREYLEKHWFTDILAGLVYGAVLLGPFVAGVRMIAGPAVAPDKAGA
jgi:hypothetical protein